MDYNFRPTLYACFCILTLISGTNSPTAKAAISTDDLRQQVFQFIDKQLKNDNSKHRIEIDVAQLDSRLKLSDCSEKLSFRLHGQNVQQGRILVKTSCHGDKPWSIFVASYVKRFIPVATNKHPLQRGQKINAADLVLQERDISKLRSNYYTNLAQLNGLIVRRSLPEQTALQSHQLEAANLIKRGDEVYIRASHGPISVQMPAVALSKGKMGEQIRVRNRSSNKIVRARVTGLGQVEVVM